MSKQNTTRKAPETSLKMAVMAPFCSLHYLIACKDQPENSWFSSREDDLCCVEICNEKASFRRPVTVLLKVW